MLADHAKRLTEGDFSAKVPNAKVVELQDVAVAFNRLTEELKARLSELGHERDEMQTLIDCMAEGVVALTQDARLLRTNRTARALLGLPETREVQPVSTVIRDPELKKALEDSVTRARAVTRDRDPRTEHPPGIQGARPRRFGDDSTGHHRAADSRAGA